MANNIPPSIPSKKLAAPLAAAGTALILNDINDWNGTALTAADVPALMYVTLYNDAKTKEEIIEVDGTTIANAITVGATINKRGLSFDGGTTASVKTAYDWNAGDTTVQLGSNPPQYYVSRAGTETITGAKTFTGGVTFTSSVSVSSSLEVTGALTVSSASTLTGNVGMSSDATIAGKLDITSGLTASTANFSSGIQSGGNITASSGINATTGTFTSGLSAINLSLSSGLSATTGTFSSGIQANNAIITSGITATTGNFSSGIQSGGHITASSGISATTGSFSSGINVADKTATAKLQITSGGGVTSGYFLMANDATGNAVWSAPPTGTMSSSDFVSYSNSTSTVNLGNYGIIASTANISSGINIGAQAYFSTATANSISGGAVTIDWTKGNKQTLNTTGNGTVTFTAPSGPTNLILKLVHDATTAAHTITWPGTSSVVWAGGTAFTSSTPSANAVDIVAFYYDGKYYGQASSSFS